MSTPRTTTLGTPCSDKWDREWVEQVDHTEQQLGRRICGAHSPAWTPCKLGSTHKNGRCRFHGGAKGIGAPLGNRNAIIHGLYSRRLQRCGLHCPLWQWCPQSGKDVLELEERERPPCVYEAQEYDAVTFSLEKGPAGRYGEDDATDPSRHCEERSDAAISATASRNDSPDSATSSSSDANASEETSPSYRPEGPFGPTCSFSKEKVGEVTGGSILHHNIATFQVMLTRAQSALSIAKLTEDAHANTETYSMTTPKVSALLQAEAAITRELRQWLRLLAYEPLRKVLGLKDPDEKKLSLPEIMMPILAKTEGVLENALRPRPPRDDDENDEDDDWGTDDLDPAPA